MRDINLAARFPHIISKSSSSSRFLLPLLMCCAVSESLWIRWLTSFLLTYTKEPCLLAKPYHAYQSITQLYLDEKLKPGNASMLNVTEGQQIGSPNDSTSFLRKVLFTSLVIWKGKSKQFLISAFNENRRN